jgi:acetyl-CoA synthetase
MGPPIAAQDLSSRGLAPERAEALAAAANQWLQALPPELCWQRLSREQLDPRVPFDVHLFVYDRVFAGWEEAARGPRPAWMPTPEEAARTNIAALMRARGFQSYEDLYHWSITDRAGYWGLVVEHLGIPLRRPYDRVLDESGGPEHPRWLPGARLNIVEACFRADPGAPAIVTGGPQGALRTISYRTLCQQVGRISSALRAAGFQPGDALAIDMPMTAEAVAIYLGVVASGMAVVSIADALAPDEVATRLRIARATGIFTAYDVERAGKRLPLYSKVLQANPPRAIVLDTPTGATLRANDVTWEVFFAGGSTTTLAAVETEPDAPTNILFSSGTTGEPKAIPWTHLTPIKAAVDGALHLDIKPGEVVAWPTNLGWMMGPWLIYASLINRATMALFLDAPTGRGFGKFIQDARVNVLGLVPSIVKAWRADDRMRGLDFSAIKCFGSTGEASNAIDYLYLMSLAGYRPVIEYCGGTEIGGGYLTGSLVQPQSPATFSTPALGSEVVILDEEGRPATNGELFLVPPTLGYSQHLLNRDHHQAYFEGTPRGPGGELLRRHGDQMERLAAGTFRAHGRVDDTMNLGGIKVSSAEIERVLDAVPGVRRTAAIASHPPGGGPSELVIYAVVDDPQQDEAALQGRLQQAIRARLNPLFRISKVVVVESLPVTASNKIMRRALRAR